MDGNMGRARHVSTRCRTGPLHCGKALIRAGLQPDDTLIHSARPRRQHSAVEAGLSFEIKTLRMVGAGFR